MEYFQPVIQYGCKIKRKSKQNNDVCNFNHYSESNLLLFEAWVMQPQFSEVIQKNTFIKLFLNESQLKY